MLIFWWCFSYHKVIPPGLFSAGLFLPQGHPSGIFLMRISILPQGPPSGIFLVLFSYQKVISPGSFSAGLCFYHMDMPTNFSAPEGHPFGRNKFNNEPSPHRGGHIYS
jgi:hypothetical protein